MFSFWAYLFRKQPKGLEYLEQIMTGTGIVSTSSPAYRVRERLAVQTRTSRHAQTEAVLRGWTFFRDGKEMQLLKITGSDLPKL